MASTKIYRTRTLGAEAKKFTLSIWFKRAAVGVAQRLITNYASAGNLGHYELKSDDTLSFYDEVSSVTNLNWITKQKFRDTSAWYHVVIAADSSESVQADRIKPYINGVLVPQADLTLNTNPSLNISWAFQLASATDQFRIGCDDSDAKDYDGCMSWFQFVDGLALAPTEFGEVDTTSGIWKIKPTPYATPGTNGFCLAMEDRTNLDLDTSSNALTFTTGGTLTATYDNPSNNFCTVGPAMSPLKATIFANGNTFVEADNIDVAACCTLGVSKGSWYMEAKATDTANTTIIGLVPAALINEDPSTMGFDIGSANNALNKDPSVGLRYNGSIYEKVDGSQVTATTTSFATGDIVGFAFNIDTGALRFWKDGVEMTGSPYTLGDGSYSSTNWVTAVPLLPAFRLDGGAVTILAGWECNFGNGYFGTTAVVSTNADAAGIGSFEYEVPASHYALCTKNIKVYG